MSTDAETAERLRVLVITEDDPLYVIRFFESFFPAVPVDIELIGITVSAAFHESTLSTARRMLGFYGPVDFARLCMRFASVKLRRHSIPRLARAAGIPVLEASSVNDPGYLKQVRELAPDVIVSVAAPEIFKEELLSIPRLGCVNIHSGRLPRYRGMMPTFWQLLAGEAHATVTIHEMVAKLDAGRILATLDFPLHKRDRLDRVIRETKQAGAGLMIDVLQQLRQGRTEPRELDMEQADYHSFPTKKDVRAFRDRGHRML